PGLKFQPLDISDHRNDNLGLVHAHEYLSPRSPYCSLQITTDLFRDWCHSSHPPCGKLDLGILKAQTANSKGILLTKQGIPFRATADGKNIAFVSQWDNFPKQIDIPVDREASHAYLLMASVTNPMQTGVVNGRVVFNLADGEKEILELVGADNLSWCVDHYPGRYGPLYLIEPTVRLGQHVYATIYHVPFGRTQRIKSLSLEAVCNESVIGLMGLTLLRVGQK
ncbi:MAG: hypothetical protein U9N87_09195, partial [Planctomycetota bacterium]|nr:hypothetical protein [Planctomycetota bacterium]